MNEAPHPHTITHARLRRSQGDVRAAKAILEQMVLVGLDVDGSATAELQQLSPRRRPIDPRIPRLKRWLKRLQSAG
jgi:hypothetical protein